MPACLAFLLERAGMVVPGLAKGGGVFIVAGTRKPDVSCGEKGPGLSNRVTLCCGTTTGCDGDAVLCSSLLNLAASKSVSPGAAGGSVSGSGS